MDSRVSVTIGSDYYLIAELRDYTKVKKPRVRTSLNYGFRMYKNPYGEVVGIYKHPKHIEPLLGLATEFHTIDLLTKCYVGALIEPSNLGTRTHARARTLDLVIVKGLKSRELLNLTSVAEKCALEIYSVLGNLTVIFCSSGQRKDIEKIIPITQVEKRSLDLLMVAENESPSMSKKHPYRLLAARISEYRNEVAYLRDLCQKIHLLMKQIPNAERSSDMYKDAAAEIRSIQVSIESDLHDLNILTSQERATHFRSILYYLSHVEPNCRLYRQWLGAIKNMFSHQLDLLSIGDNARRLQLPLSGEMDLLKCLELTVTDFVYAVGGQLKHPLLVLDEDGPLFRIAPWSAPLSWKRIPGRIGHSSLWSIGVPSRYLYRLGLLPLLAHVMGHAFLTDWWRAGHPLRSTMLRFYYSFRDELNRSCRENPDLMFRTQELFADMFATLVCGPSYLYAFLRAFRKIPRISQYDYDLTIGVAMVDLRFLAITQALKSIGITARISSSEVFLEEDLPENQLSFISLVSSAFENMQKVEAVIEPYSRTEHNIAVRKAKASLAAGKIVSYRPRIVLNALWDAVFDKDIYVNEIASLFSILARKDQTTE